MKKVRVPVCLISCVLGSVFLPSASASAAGFQSAALPHEENGILTLEDGQKWYKVNGFEDNSDYIITVRNGAGETVMLTATDGDYTQYIWNYSRTYMTASTEPMVMTLTTGRFMLSCVDGELYPYYEYRDGDRIWAHEDSVLRYSDRRGTLYLKYNAESNPPFIMTADRDEASEVILYSRITTLARCITRQPAAETYVIEESGYAAPVFSVGISDVIPDRVQWFVDGEEQPCSSLTFHAETLRGQTAGVHSVYCVVEAHDSDGVFYCEQSAEATFVIAKGVLPDSVMTFSDIHEEYWLIGKAIKAVMNETDGYIPSLVICSGDFVNGPTAEKERELKRYFPQIVSALGGLDAVFVSGNHDSAEAASLMSTAADLGAAPDLPAAGGLIFDGESDAVQKHGRNSRFAKGILTYGINFDAARKETEYETVYTYEGVIGGVETFLKSATESYHGELIVISAHSGLHVIGMQPESVNYYDYPLSEWIGYNHYNLDRSYELAETINRYAQQYGMDILYLFGHNHSRGEKELFLTDGSRLISTECYADKQYSEQTLHFTYANAGYLSSAIGAADSKFSLIYRDGDRISYDLLSAAGGSVRHADILAKHPYEEPAPVDTTSLSEVNSAGASETTETTTVSVRTADIPEKQPSASGTEIPAPAAGESGNTAVIILLLSAVLLFGMMIRQKRDHSAE